MLGQFDIAAKFYDAVAGSTKEVANEVATEAKNVIVEEIKQVAQGQSPLATTESLFSFAQNATNSSAVAVVPFVQEKLATYFDPNSSAVAVVPFAQEKLATYFDPNSTALVPFNGTVDAAKEGSTSWLGYGVGAALTFGTGVYVLSQLYKSKKKAEVTLSAEARPILEQAQGFLNALDNLLKNEAVKAILRALTGQQAAQLKALADAQPSYFADLAALPAPVQLVQLNNAIKPVAAQVLPVAVNLNNVDLSAVNLNDILASSSANPVMGTQAEKAASKSSAVDIMISPEAKLVLAGIAKHDKAMQVLGKMEEKSLKLLAHNAAKIVAKEKFPQYNDVTFVALLTGYAKMAGQEITLEAAKPAVEVEKKSALKV
jgi:hypothetical protein